MKRLARIPKGKHMRNWEIWTHHIPETEDHVFKIHVTDGPWWAFFLGWIADHVVPNWSYKLKLPDWPRIKWPDSEGERYSLREWYGDIGSVLSCHLASPLMSKVCRLRCLRTVELEVSEEQLLMQFANASDFPLFYLRETEKEDLR